MCVWLPTTGLNLSLQPLFQPCSALQPRLPGLEESYSHFGLSVKAPPSRSFPSPPVPPTGRINCSSSMPSL